LVPAGGSVKAASGPGSAQAILDWLESHALPDYARRSAEEIDAAIEQERRSWD